MSCASIKQFDLESHDFGHLSISDIDCTSRDDAQHITDAGFCFEVADGLRGRAFKHAFPARATGDDPFSPNAHFMTSPGPFAVTIMVFAGQARTSPVGYCTLKMQTRGAVVITDGREVTPIVTHPDDIVAMDGFSIVLKFDAIYVNREQRGVGYGLALTLMASKVAAAYVATTCSMIATNGRRLDFVRPTASIASEAGGDMFDVFRSSVKRESAALSDMRAQKISFVTC